ncbi:TPR repeat [Acidisarcina polymorpha]|uniref:TPR repeat n=1 Tax=Acidisarcina polymorpha TaxID=2211140 RepID=A0A2Z5G7Q8_9BACT|nr:hypothetical protein [Acidisarcina polymorpha]AXC14606.1 TPR repeat [Acidisarcina polymorpha]
MNQRVDIDALSCFHEAEECLAERSLVKAVRGFNQAEQMGADPDECAGKRWLCSMLMGEFDLAWMESDAIRTRGHADPHHFWNGEELKDKTVVVRCLHGLGDAIQFLRYSKLLGKMVGKLIVEVPPALYPLAPFVADLGEPPTQLITWGPNAPSVQPKWDVQLEVTELPYVFRTLLGDLPLSTSYLVLPDKMVKHVAQVMGQSERRRVGVVWAAGQWNQSRSVQLTMLSSLLDNCRVDWWSLQGGTAAQEWGRYRTTHRRYDASSCGEGLLPLAAAIANLDLVITVDTLAAHLAGSMGKPAWVMLQYAADWRWMIDRADSPWYPSLRLFRQPSPGDWSSVVECLRQELDCFDANRK